MEMPIKGPSVFLDANIVIRAGKPPGGPEIDRVGDLVDAGFVKFLTTDLTVTEVVKKHADNDYEVVKEIARPHFRKISEDVVGVKIEKISKTEIREKLRAIYHESVSKMFNRLKAHRLEIDAVKPTAVFASYADGTGFFSGEGKKDQFPDAFIFECIKQVASAKLPVIIVSDDGDFDKPAEDEEFVLVIKSLPELFQHLGYEMEAPLVKEFLDGEADTLIQCVEQEVNNWGLVGDVEDSEIYGITVNDVVLENITAFKPVDEGDSILAVGKAKVNVTAEYSHPDWDTASYDSEDKVLIPWDEVDGETEIEISIDVSVSIAVDEAGNLKEIEALSFRNSDFQYVALHPFEHYK
tara:strand:- start:1275 stop:2330 length:1056 start_codon:yes stop_codon:yes gene_type:complete